MIQRHQQQDVGETTERCYTSRFDLTHIKQTAGGNPQDKRMNSPNCYT